MPLNTLKNKKRALAAEMAEVRKGRSAQQQLAELDRRLGQGNGAKRERAKLAAQISKGS